MAGHSKWKNIAQKKGKNDAKRAGIFTKIGREMAVAIREGGADPQHNAKLRDCIAKAKANNVPGENIKRMIDKYTGGGEAIQYETIVYEGYGPSGTAVIVEAMTDNRNRTASEVRHAFDKHGAGLGASGCVAWQFDRFGILVVEAADRAEDEAMMDALEAGALDFLSEDGFFEIFTPPDAFSAIREALEQKGYDFVSSEVSMVPQNTVSLEDASAHASMQKLLDALEDNDDVQNVWHNCGGMDED